MNALTIRDLSVVAGEPRVRDIKLAQSLGMQRPRNIRQLIERNRPELRTYGELPLHGAANIHSEALPHSGAKRGRGRPMGSEGAGFYLSEPQALLICMFSQTDQAVAVRRQLIEVFMAYRAGELQAAPQPRGKRKLPPVYTAADPEHPDFRDPIKPLVSRRHDLLTLRGTDGLRIDETMIRSLPHILAPTSATKRITWPRWFHDKEVLTAVVRTHRAAALHRVVELLEANFGYRAPSKSSLGRFWLRLDGLFGTGRKLH